MGDIIYEKLFYYLLYYNICSFFLYIIVLVRFFEVGV